VNSRARLRASLEAARDTVIAALRELDAVEGEERQTRAEAAANVQVTDLDVAAARKRLRQLRGRA